MIMMKYLCVPQALNLQNFILIPMNSYSNFFPFQYAWSPSSTLIWNLKGHKDVVCNKVSLLLA